MTKSTKNYSVTVDYEHSFEQMIKNGRYDYVYHCIQERNFPLTVKESYGVAIVLINFGQRITSENIEILMKRFHCRPVNTEEALALGAEHSYLQTVFPIIALRSKWADETGVEFVLCLDSDKITSRRILDIERVREWDYSYYFAAVSIS